MKRLIKAMTIAASLLSPAITGAEEIVLKLLATTDVHGNFFPYDFIKTEDAPGSFARVASYVKSVRDYAGKENVVLLDNGDILQGQPTAYYYNYIDTLSAHPVTRMINYLGYDAETVGNHDIETGHPVYDRYRKDLGTVPYLAANVIDKATGQPYFQPYAVIDRHGVRIAVLGLTTPAIPAWLPEKLWEGLEFEDMLDAASKWVNVIKEKERPDILVGLFHSGNDSTVTTGGRRENASRLVAEKVLGFDVVFTGHDHKVYTSDPDDNEMLPVILNPANNALNIAEAEIKLDMRDGKVKGKNISGKIVDISNIEPDGDFVAEFSSVRDSVDAFVTRKIGVATGEFNTIDAYFGPSAFMQLLHDLQLSISGAQISFAAPLTFDAVIKEGDLTVSDMFKLYKYENMLYTMKLTGREIKDYLEMSYALWTDVVKDPDGHLLLFADGVSGSTKGGFAGLKNPAYNFDSAAGIDYTVDITKPRGQKINIISMSDGTPFDMEKYYTVAINSYRGNGGGDLLTKGAGIGHSELSSRVIDSTDKDLRYYLMKEIERIGSITPTVNHNWKFIPEDIAAPAAAADRKLLLELF